MALEVPPASSSTMHLPVLASFATHVTIIT